MARPVGRQAVRPGRGVVAIGLVVAADQRLLAGRIGHVAVRPDPDQPGGLAVPVGPDGRLLGVVEVDVAIGGEAGVDRQPEQAAIPVVVDPPAQV